MGYCHIVRILTSLAQEISQKNHSNQTEKPTKDKQNERERERERERVTDRNWLLGSASIGIGTRESILVMSVK